MRKISNFILTLSATGLLTCTGVLLGCSKDDNIDLGEIDTTIGVGADGLTLPSSKTNQIKLSDVLKLNEGDCVQVLDKDSLPYQKGDYQFKKSDKINPAAPKVKQVSFGSPVIPDRPAFTVEITPEMASIAGTVNPGALPLITIPEKEIKAFSFSNAGEKAVISLTHATTEDMIVLDLHVQEINEALTNASFELKFPDFIEASILNANDNAITFDNNTHTLKLDNVSLNKDKHVELKMAGLTNFKTSLTDADTDESDYLLVNKDAIKLNGHIKMAMIIDPGYLRPGITAGTKTISTNIDLGDEINITNAEGIFDPEITINPSNVEIGNSIPDFLTDDQVKIDLANPAIKLTVKNNINAKANIDAKMIAYYDDAKKDSLFLYIDGKKDGLTIQPHVGDVKGETTTTIVICRTAGSNPAYKYIAKGNKNATKRTKEKSERTDLGQLLERIPKSLRFELEAHTDQTYKSTIDLYNPKDEEAGKTDAVGLQYKIDPSYEFVAPFELNPGSTIVYKDTVDGWNDDIKKNEIELYDGKIVVTGSIYNSTPLELHMKPTAIGTNKLELSGVSINVLESNDNTLFVGSNYGNGNSTPFTIEIARNGGSLKELDGILFNVKAVSSVKGTLNSENQTIQISDIKITINGKVSINLDSKD